MKRIRGRLQSIRADAWGRVRHVVAGRDPSSSRSLSRGKPCEILILQHGESVPFSPNVGVTKEVIHMHIAKADVPVKINVPGAVARQLNHFGDARGYGQMAGEYFSLAAGLDIAPLLKGLKNDLCQSPHWGYLIQGEVTVTYEDATQETVRGGDLFYWPPGHTVRVGQDAEVILFSPQHEHGQVLDHLLTQLG